MKPLNWSSSPIVVVNDMIESSSLVINNILFQNFLKLIVH